MLVLLLDCVPLGSPVVDATVPVGPGVCTTATGLEICGGGGKNSDGVEHCHIVKQLVEQGWIQDFPKGGGGGG